MLLAPLAPLMAFTVPTSPEQMDAVSVAPDVYVVHGMPGLPSPKNRGMIANLGFVVTPQGVVIVDSGGTSEQAERLLDAIKSVTDQPAIAVFNTHIHGDHWLGNSVIVERYPEVLVYGHPTMHEHIDNGAGQRWVDLYEQLTEGTARIDAVYGPTSTAKNGDTFDYGSFTLSVIGTDKSHTDNDLMIHITLPSGDDVIFLGDNSFHERIGRMDDGHFKGNIEALNKAISLNAAVYVPGHGPTTKGTQSAVTYRDFLELLYSKTQALFEDGLTDYEIKDQIIDDFTPWKSWDGFEQTFGRLVSLVYLEIEEASF